MHYAIRSLCPSFVKGILFRMATGVLFSDATSAKLYRKAACARVVPAEDESEYYALQVRMLGGHIVKIRSRGSDSRVLFDVFFHQFHMPPKDLAGPVNLVVDLGANIGLTMAHFACRFPSARVVGVELDRDNAMLCRGNVSAWAERCALLQAALWHTDGTLAYEYNDACQSGMSVHAPDIRTPLTRDVRAVCMSTLLAEFSCGTEPIDYLKMDIEGAERAVLENNAAWANQVRCIKVELHGDYSVTQCARDLQGLGFETRCDAAHPLCVVGLRR